MHELVMAVFLAAAGASQEAAVVATVNKFVDSFNKGDAKAAVAMCAAETSIIDEFPPHEWHGAGACERWLADFDADATKNGITDAIVTMGKLRHVDVTGDRAYVVSPVDYSYKQKGKPVKETGSTFTLVLQNVGGSWRLTGWAWSKN
jgi:ketosteroid isomerase-like protein